MDNRQWWTSEYVMVCELLREGMRNQCFINDNPVWWFMIDLRIDITNNLYTLPESESSLVWEYEPLTDPYPFSL